MRRLDFCVTAMITVSVEYFSKYLSGSYLLNYLGLLHSRSWSWQLFRMSVNVWLCPELLNLLQPNWLWWCIIRSIRQKYWLAIFMQKFVSWCACRNIGLLSSCRNAYHDAHAEVLPCYDAEIRIMMRMQKYWLAIFMQMFILQMPTHKDWFAVLMQMFMLRMPPRKHWLAVSM